MARIFSDLLYQPSLSTLSELYQYSSFQALCMWAHFKYQHYLTLSYIRRSLWMFAPKLKSRKKNCTFFSLNLFSIPRDIPWHHWKNLLTSKRGRSGGLNFFTKFAQILIKTSGGSRNLNFDPICKCHTILETSWGPYEALHNLIDLRGH